MVSVLAAAAPAVPAGLGAAGLIATAFGWAVFTLFLYAHRKSFKPLGIWLADKMDTIHVDVKIKDIRPLAQLSGSIRSLVNAIDNALAGAALRCETATIWLANQVWAMIIWQARELADLAVTVEHALGLQRVVDIPKVLRTAIAPILTRIHGIDRLMGRIEAQAHAQWKRLRHGIDRIEGIATKTIPKALGKVTTRVGRLEKTLAGWRAHPARLVSVIGIAGAVALFSVAIKRLGLQFLRCGNFKKTGKALCGMDATTLDALLGASLLVVGAFSLREFARDLQEPVELVTKGLENLITEL